MNWEQYIHTNAEVLAGKPVLKGTRLSVEFILGRFANGWSEETVLENYPGLTREMIQAVFAYAQDCMENGFMYAPLSKKAG